MNSPVWLRHLYLAFYPRLPLLPGATSQNFLRGTQVTDANDQATFTAIFLGGNSGRVPHIHVDVYPSLASAISYAYKIRTSQFSLDRSVCSMFHKSVTDASASVSNLAARRFSTESVFSDNLAVQLAP